MGVPLLQRCLKLSLWVFCFAGCIQQGNGPLRDLTKEHWRVKAGFVPADAQGIPQGAGVPARNFPVPPQPLSESRDAARLLTWHTKISLQSAGPPAALYFSELRGRWTVFLNGEKVAAEIFGRPVTRKLVLPLPADLVRKETNDLVVVTGALRGTDARMGLGVKSAGYWVGPFATLIELRDESPLFMTIALYVLIVLFLLGTAPLVRRRGPQLSLAFLLLGFAAYLATRTATFLETIPSVWAPRLELAALLLTGAGGAKFTTDFILLPAVRPALLRVYFYFCLAAAAAAMGAPLATLGIARGVFEAFTLALAVGAAGALASGRWSFDPNSLDAAAGFGAVLAAAAVDRAGLSPAAITPLAFLLFVLLASANLARRFLSVYREAERLTGELRERENRFQSLYDATLEAICIRRGNVVLEANQAFLRLYGYRPEEVAGKPFTQFFSADSQRTVVEGLEVDYRPYEAAGVTLKGERFFAELLNKPISYDGGMARVTAVRDITEQKNALVGLEARNHELEQMTKQMVERELRMVELKRQIETARREDPKG